MDDDSDSVTFLDMLLFSLCLAGGYNSQVEVAPAAVLWPDFLREWEELIPALRKRMPVLMLDSVLTLGPYAPGEDTGPAVWLRYGVARTIGGAPSDQRVPVVYLPGVSLDDLLDVRDLPRELMLLAELRFRSNIWCETPPDFMRGNHGLRIAMGWDAETRKALQRALPVVADMTLAQLQAEAPWKAKDFDALLGFKAQAHGPSIPELITRGESAELEFKATARVDPTTGQKPKFLEQNIVKAVAAFLNSAHGGMLLIGVNDDGSIRGIEEDYKAWSNPADRGHDKYQLWLMKLLQDAYGTQFMPYVRVTFHNVEGKDICCVRVAPAPKPVIVKDGNDERFYVRTGNSSPWLKLSEALDYIKTRWEDS